LQVQVAKKLMEAAGLKQHTGACGISELEKLQASLPNFQIKLRSKDLCDAVVCGTTCTARHSSISLFQSLFNDWVGKGIFKQELLLRKL